MLVKTICTFQGECRNDHECGDCDYLHTEELSTIDAIKETEEEKFMREHNIEVVKKAYDAVSYPKHYNSGKYEVIDIIESIVNSMNLTPFEGYCLGNTIKYIARFKNKNGTEDLKKAEWYLNRLEKVGGADE